MKYVNRVEINLPISKVVALWEDESNYPEWQEGFIKINHISGTARKESAKSEIFLRYNGKDMKLLQTVLKADMPREKRVLVEHQHMTNTMTSRFRELANDRTEYISEIDYIKFNGIVPKLISKLFPGMFKKQSQKWLDQFKVFAENR